MEQKFRSFCFTDFVCNADFWQSFVETNKVVWLKYGKEKTSEGKDHFQGVVYFKSPHTLTSIIKKLKPRHVEICRGNIEQNDVYVSKDGDCVEFGEKPNQGCRRDLNDVKKKIKEGATKEDVREMVPYNTWLQYGRRLMEDMAEFEVKRDWVTEVIIFQGITGSGKSKKAKEMGAKAVWISGSYDDPFIRGYNGEDIVVFNEFCPDRVKLEWVLDMTDRYEFEINVKGGSRNWKPKTIIMTTNEDARKWWRSNPAWNRRISEIIDFC